MRRGSRRGSIDGAVGVPSHPPLPCRASPPQGGRSAASAPMLFPKRWEFAKADMRANLPPCGPVALLSYTGKEGGSGQCGVPCGSGLRPDWLGFDGFGGFRAQCDPVLGRQRHPAAHV
ncbi:hypothetical protein EOA19_20505, partial [Mesorhizobium sp. M7A.F.Ca.US.010.02.1.1]